MTDPTEQTVTEAVYERFPYSMPLPSETIAVLGIDPDVPLSRLREDLVIAARARACASDERFDNVDGPDGETFYTPERLLAYLLGGEQP